MDQHHTDQQLHLPEQPSKVLYPNAGELVYPIPYEFDERTMPVPRGPSSALSELAAGNLTSAEAMIYLFMNHGSTWLSGESWCLSTPRLAELGHMSRRYVRGILDSLIEKGWIEILSTSNPAGHRYKLKHHLCESDDTPVGFNGKRLSFAVPCGAGGPIERCSAGDIPWKAALVWIVLKQNSEWRPGRSNTGHTMPLKLQTLAKNCRIGLKNLQEMLKILEEQGMLWRLTPKSKPAVFQLYPKPYPRAAPRSYDKYGEPVSPNKLRFDGQGFVNAKYFYSKNKKYRCEREVGTIFGNMERWVNNGWKKVSDFHRRQEMNPNIIKYFNECFAKQREYGTVSVRASGESKAAHNRT